MPGLRPRVETVSNLVTIILTAYLTGIGISVLAGLLYPAHGETRGETVARTVVLGLLWPLLAILGLLGAAVPRLRPHKHGGCR